MYIIYIYIHTIHIMCAFVFQFLFQSKNWHPADPGGPVAHRVAQLLEIFHHIFHFQDSQPGLGPSSNGWVSTGINYFR